ncbi:potassium/sodium hyperpolarization-activated cyclic nucleotide-gated channel 2 [Xyrauchen texanus]|uniref:potassium/sodium hyperpolarization-activated cyclic nucleotide-gated channel 2 n=1 Tax=Xyrauchen texanus TaxID=154827 RepID=UPI002242863B|nr:potassium/sodium hyperpolarization-activated cyclic nucleotide-gated channel 2 [Xyrauchen texanus]XP_051951163.1 potassium/sodium hyperpolarization-activated cyclic nucleotide-gated channel 2 [Xyrauchen texanus]XP_051951164.1 potassium/sodium hyperpolarization-activated cyclic nucleotide-gated channel 2 [Xyrauchen texanus]
MFMVALTFVNLITIPLEMAFADDLHDVTHKCWLAFNVFSDLIFCVDVGLNFRIGFLDGQVPILDPKHIRKDYLSTWFFPDVVAAFPVDIIVVILEHHYHADASSLIASKMLRVLMFVRVLGLIRLLRVPRLLRFCSQLEGVSAVQIKRSFRYIFVILMIFLIWHWNGCIQYFLSALAEFPPDCWVMRENLLNTSIGEKYSFGLCRALSQMTLMSADPPTRICMEEWWNIMISRVIGFFILIALLAYMIISFGNTYKKKKKMLKSSEIFKLLPSALRQRITQHYQWQFENSILDTVTKPLKKDIMAAVCPNLLTKGSMFKNCDANFIDAILMKLECEFFQPGDIIIRQNDQADRMYFIEIGRVLQVTEFKTEELCDGDQFGDIGVLLRGDQMATVHAVTGCRLFTLSVDKLQELEEEFPEDVNILRAAAQQRADLEFQAPSTSSSV